MAAIIELEAALLKVAPDAFNKDQPWFKTWSTAGKQHDYSAGISLIKEFEGVHLEAYADPLHGWDVATIGYGTTRYGDGRKVQRGDKITSVESDMLLRLEVDRIGKHLAAAIPHWDDMSDKQKGALISFAYNLGPAFYGATGFETISKRLRDKAWTEVPTAFELYRNPGSNVEAGLLRRRRAEGKLWLEGMTSQPVQQTVEQAQPAKLSPKSPFSAMLTPNIRIGEFALDQEVRRFNYQHQVDTAAELAAFMERVRKAFGNKPVTITSGYRPPAINRSIGGASGSEHLFDAPSVGAVDFYIKGADINAVERWIDKEWPFSHGYGAKKGFHHVGIRRGRPRVRWDY